MKSREEKKKDLYKVICMKVWELVDCLHFFFQFTLDYTILCARI